VDFRANLLNMAHSSRSVNLRSRDLHELFHPIRSGTGLDEVDRGGSQLAFTQLNCAYAEGKLRTADCRDGFSGFAASVSIA
jgi:hypothetical protein